MKYHSYFSSFNLYIYIYICSVSAINKATNSLLYTFKENKPLLLARSFARSPREFVSKQTKTCFSCVLIVVPFHTHVAWNSFPVSSFIWRKEELNEAKGCLSLTDKQRGEIPSRPLCNCSSHRRIFYIVADSWFRSVYLCAWESREMTLTAFS